jgi:hypothetical protein
MSMFNLNKIRGHIKVLEFQKRKLELYLAEVQKSHPEDLQRLQDIERSLRRVTEGLDNWSNKLAQFESAPPAQPSRPSVIDGPDRPLIG